jgi:hypothetical protein
MEGLVVFKPVGAGGDPPDPLMQGTSALSPAPPSARFYGVVCLS